MFENKGQNNIRDFEQRVAQQGLNLDMYLGYMGMDRASFESMMKEKAVNDVKYELAIEKIVELEDLKAAEEEIEKEYADMAEQYKLDVEKIKEIIPSDAVEEQIKRRNAAKLVIDTAVPVAPAAKEEAPAEKAEEE